MPEEEIDKQLKVVYARLDAFHPAVSMVLQIHLVIEDHINEILELQTKNFSQIKDMNFAVKFRLLKALSDKSLSWSVYKVIESINKLRNEVSHHAWDKNYEGLKKAFFNLRDLLKSLDFMDPEDLSKKKPDEYLYAAAGYACGGLYSIIEDLKKERSVRGST